MILLLNMGTVDIITKAAIEIADPKFIQEHHISMHAHSHFKTGHRMIIKCTSTAAFKFFCKFSQHSAHQAARNAYMGYLQSKILTYECQVIAQGQ